MKQPEPRYVKRFQERMMSRKGTCKYYRSPIHFSSCSKDVDYLELSGGERKGYLRRLPCVNTRLSIKGIECAMYKDPTDKEIEEWNELIKNELESLGWKDNDAQTEG